VEALEDHTTRCTPCNLVLLAVMPCAWWYMAGFAQGCQLLSANGLILAVLCAVLCQVPFRRVHLTNGNHFNLYDTSGPQVGCGALTYTVQPVSAFGTFQAEPQLKGQSRSKFLCLFAYLVQSR